MTVQKFIARISAAGLALVFSVSAALSASLYPSGMTEDEIAKFEVYERKVIRFLREQGDGFDIGRLSVEFPNAHGAWLVEEVFDDDWSAIRAYADGALADLPVTKLEDKLTATPAFRLEVGQQTEKLFSLPDPQRRRFEARLAASRFWDPQVVARTAASMLEGQMGTAEDVARNSLYGNYVQSRLAKTLTGDGQALVSFSGLWTYVVDIERSPRGLIFMTRVSAYPR
ncbi:hypothetical protein [Roseibium sp.]|uniref:hypothetical protein n=1 Tax=Roseibium sp. TaxID=1936156 RepID=UPI003D0D202D